MDLITDDEINTVIHFGVEEIPQVLDLLDPST